MPPACIFEWDDYVDMDSDSEIEHKDKVKVVVTAAMSNALVVESEVSYIQLAPNMDYT